jgi:hypothetical protein
MRHSLSAEVGNNLADKRRSVGIVRLRTKATEFSFSLDLSTIKFLIHNIFLVLA